MNTNTDNGKITFSILMANYNNEKYIVDAIESVLSQSYQYWELIIVDDCSTDKSIERINPFLTDKRIKLIRNGINKGYGGALKTGLSSCQYPLICYTDSDGQFDFKEIKKFLQKINGADLVIGFRVNRNDSYQKTRF